MRFAQEFIDEVRNSNNIVDVISEYISLKRSGRNYFGNCPFHNEKTPSFSVSEDKQIFKCFGCGIGGNVYTFISQINNINFVESVELLARRANIALPKVISSFDTEKESLKEKVYKVNEKACEFFHQRLYDTNIAKIAQDYVKKRQFNNQTLKDFKIGFSGTYHELYDFLKKENFNDEEIFESGLVNLSENGKYFDRYRNRLMFPIFDIRNRVIGFGGRVLDDSKPKYINSPENIVYSKSNHLYGLNLAKKHDLSKILVVEGYMDVISLHQRGVKNAVAVLGTALTDKQVYLIKNYSKKVILSFDKDSAGQNAINRSIDISQKLGIKPLILQLDKDCKDPDEYILKYGNIRFQNCIENSISPIEFRTKLLENTKNLEKTQDKLEFLNELSVYIFNLDNEFDKEIYIDKMSKKYDISKEAIYAQLNKLKYAKENPNINRSNYSKVNLKSISDARSRLKQREYSLINLLIKGGYEVYEILKQLLEEFIDDNLKNIVNNIYNQYEKNQNCDINILMQELSIEEQSILSDVIMIDEKISDFESCIDNIINSYIKDKLKYEKEILIQKIELESDLQKKEQYEKQLQDVILKLVK